MKKLIALLVAALLVLSMSIPAFAAVDTTGWKSEAQVFTGITKTYTTTTGDFPHETLSFVSTPFETNPDGTNLTIDDLEVTQLSGDQLTVNVPVYEKVGVYKYTITETPGDAQGVTYSTEEIGISVLVSYDYDNSCLKVEKIGVTKPEDGSDKNEAFENEYKFGGNNDGTDSLKVTKTVTGNLGDKNKEFEITVTLETEDGLKVYSDIEVDAKGETSNTNNKQTIAQPWTGTKTVTINLKDGETITFDNIPDGVTYKVEEKDIYWTDTNKNGENGYDEAVYEDKTGTITNEKTPLAKITNNKENTIETGITLETLPYILVLGLALVGAVLMIARRRRNNED